MHRLISTDSGLACFACGQAFDIHETDDDGMSTGTPLLVAVRGEVVPMMLDASWVPCFQGDGTIPHHWIATGEGMECARCSAQVDAHTLPSTIPNTCREV